MSSDSKSIARVLSDNELFAELSEEQLALIGDIAEIVVLNAGEILFEENTSSDEMYIIAKGTVDIEIDPNLVSSKKDAESVTIANLVRGDILGEMALVDQGLRSATAKVTEDGTQLLKLSRDKLMPVCRENPSLGFVLMHNLAADLALKIRNTDLTLRQYQLELMYRPL